MKYHEEFEIVRNLVKSWDSNGVGEGGLASVYGPIFLRTGERLNELFKKETLVREEYLEFSQLEGRLAAILSHRLDVMESFLSSIEIGCSHHHD